MTKKSVRQILIEARKLIEKEENWCKRHYALDGAGMSTNELFDNAVCFCALGAINRSAGELLCCEDGPVSVLTEAMGAATVHEFNDTHTHAEVLAAFDRAVEAAK